MNNDLNAQLQIALDSTYHLLQQTQICHWNVRGPAFYALHAAFEVQYRELFEAVDEIAERIATLGGQPIIKGGGASLDPNASGTTMLNTLIADHTEVTKALHRVRNIAAQAEDEVSQDLALSRMAAHEKTIWMLQASID